MVKPPPPFYAVSTLPSSFSSLRAFELKLEENDSEIERIRSEYRVFDPDEEYRLHVLSYLHSRDTELTRQFNEAFAVVLTQELSKGNFEIFERPLPSAPFASTTFYLFLESAPNRSEILQRAFRVRPSAQAFDWLSDLYENLGNFIDIESAPALSKGFQDALSWSRANGKKIGGLSFNPMLTLMLDGLLRDQDLVEMFDFLFDLRQENDPGIFERILSKKIRTRIKDNPNYLETLKFPASAWSLTSNPVMVKLFNPEFFDQEFKARGIDPAVLDLLSPSWEGNFGTLLESAASLSAERI